MSEPIEYRDDGSIVIDIGEKHTLPVPTTGQARAWNRDLNERLDQTRERLMELTRAIEETEENTPERVEAERVHSQFSREPFYDTTIEWLAMVFKELAPEFPTDSDEWPAWLGTNSRIATDFVKFWMQTPKASGAPRRP
jgi:hypothetical protein